MEVSERQQGVTQAARPTPLLMLSITKERDPKHRREHGARWKMPFASCNAVRTTCSFLHHVKREIVEGRQHLGSRSVIPDFTPKVQGARIPPRTESAPLGMKIGPQLCENFQGSYTY